MKNVLIIGVTLPQIIEGIDQSKPSVGLTGNAHGMAKEFLRCGEMRGTLLTALSRDPAGRATIKLLDESGLLYRAVDCAIPTEPITISSTEQGQKSDPPMLPTLTKSIMNVSIQQTAPDYDFVIADCNLESDILFELGRISPKLVITGTNTQRCIRMMSSNPWPKAAIGIDEEEKDILMEFNETKKEQELKSLLKADNLLIISESTGWTLYNHQGKTENTEKLPKKNQIPAIRDIAIAALVHSLSENEIDPSKRINESIAAYISDTG